MPRCALLGDRGARWLALQAVGQLSPPVSALKLPLLSSPHFFRDLQQYLHKSPPSFFQNIALKKIILPFCEKYAPAIIEKSVDKIRKAFIETLKIRTFSKETFAARKLSNLFQYFTVLYGALERVSVENIITGTLEEHIEKELEVAQSSTCSTDILYTQLALKGIYVVLQSIEELLHSYVKKYSATIQLPAKMLIRQVMVGIRSYVPFLFFVLRSRICLELKKQSQNGLTTRLAKHIHHPLICAFVDSFNHILHTFFLKLSSYKDFSQVTSLGVEKTFLKHCLQQQILMLKLCANTSQRDLRMALKESTLQQALNELQNRYALPELEKLVDGLLSIFLEALKQKGFVEELFERLALSLNEGFMDSTPNYEALPQLQETIKKITSYLISHQLHQRVRQAEALIDRKFSLMNSWPNKKKALSQILTRWLGGSVHSAIDQRGVPLTLKMLEKGGAELEKFWSLPYNLRYGILHYVILLPLLNEN